MTTISAAVSSLPQAPAPVEKSSADIATQISSGTTSSLNSSSAMGSSTSPGYSGASQAAVSLILDQQDSATSASGGASAPTSASSQRSSGGAPAGGGGSSSSSTKTVTESEPDGEEIALTEDKSGKVISEKVVKAASETDASASGTSGNNKTNVV